MFAYLKKYRFQVTLFLFILIPIIALDTSTRSPREYRTYDRVIVFLTSPIQAGISWTLDQTIGFYQNYLYLWQTRRDNLALLEENRKLQGTISGLREIEQENVRLRRLLDFQEKRKLSGVIARVIAKDFSPDFRAVRINRGEKAGIQKNMSVVTDEGIVGRVLRTTANTADIMTVMDLLSAVDSIVERSRARGIVEGLTEEVCQLKFVLRTDDIRVGDILVSSGLGGIFPKGIPVGVVSEVAQKPFGITQEIEVKPSVDFSKLEEVLVLTQVENNLVTETPPEPAKPTK